MFATTHDDSIPGKLLLLLLDEKPPHSLTENGHRDSTTVIQITKYTGPKCTIGNSFSDQTKLSTAFDKLGPFVMECYTSKLKTIRSLDEVFEVTDSDDDQEETPLHLRGLQGLQLEDSVPTLECDNGHQSSEEEEGEQSKINEVPDAVLNSRTVVEKETDHRVSSGSKRKSCEVDQRKNYIKHNFRRKRRTFPNRAKPRRSRKSKTD